MSDRPQTVAAILDVAGRYLKEREIEHPMLVTQLLLSHVLRCGRLELFLKHDCQLNDNQLQLMRNGTKRLSQGEPLQYITGQTQFMGHDFLVDKRVLIPRPETELLVEALLSHHELLAIDNPFIADVGTGSGCIVISLALAKPDAIYTAIDTSKDAVELARTNATNLGVAEKITFFPCKFTDAVDPGSLNCLVANLPYIPTAEHEELPVHIRNHEPRSALDGGPDGLDIIRQLLPDMAKALKPGGLIFLEIGHNQADRVVALLKSNGFVDIRITQDLGRKDRMVSALRAP